MRYLAVTAGEVGSWLGHREGGGTKQTNENDHGERHQPQRSAWHCLHRCCPGPARNKVARDKTGPGGAGIGVSGIFRYEGRERLMCW